MHRKGKEYRQHTIQWAVARVPGSDTFKAKGSVSWTDVSGVFHLHPLSDISGRFNSEAAAERQLVDQARHWIDDRLRW
jgi:hypothetical protein